ncbi:SGNH/GDSL hydrolase family protein [Butyrivibrio sp. CB08]|uniref:SGNH/GDSL hydrolase family protein n=1 Tax=Butyrivibrio sp. CB08 TaxID=2364879 RepID=UPI000EA8CCA2|nr:SGNH/GDSL hydrolase family protein [Butyrivibrio sp. CB08]RKM57848.1 SGNH/GDSL hydrolase family protein [Butyrivibrio sp. CB08]
MKKSITFAIALLSSMSIIFTGCSLPNKDVKEATEYIGDNANTENSAEDEAASEKSIVVINDLFEPLLEEVSTAEASNEASTEEEKKEDTDEEDNVVNIVCFGDSQLANGRDDGTDIPHLLAPKVPDSRVFNMAISGTTASVEQNTSEIAPSNLTSTSFLGMVYCFEGKSDREATLEAYPGILNTMNSIEPKDVDYYVLCYGTNDFLSNVPMDADYYGTDVEKAHSLYGAMSMGISELKAVSPNATFIVITPFYGIYMDDSGAYIGDSYIVSNGIGTLSEYAEKVKNVVDDNKCYILDGMFGSRFDLYLDTANEYLMDNLHLNLTGRQIVTRILAHNINYVEGNEPFPYWDTDYIKVADFNPEETYRADENVMEKQYPESWDKYIHGEYPLAQPSIYVSEIPEDNEGH